MKRMSLAIVMALSLASCAQNQVAKEKVEQEIRELPDNAKLQKASIQERIKSSTSLTEEQKTKLLKLEEEAHASNKALTEEIEKAKIVLVETILQPKLNKQEVKILKKKIADLDKKRLQEGFKKIHEVRNIIAPKQDTSPHEHEIYKAVIENRLRGY